MTSRRFVLSGDMRAQEAAHRLAELQIIAHRHDILLFCTGISFAVTKLRHLTQLNDGEFDPHMLRSIAAEADEILEAFAFRRAVYTRAPTQSEQPEAETAPVDVEKAHVAFNELLAKVRGG